MSTAACAAAAGFALTLWGLPIQRAHFWLHWGRLGAAGLLFVYLTLGCVIGLLGWVIAEWLKWSPTTSPFLNAVAFATAGHAVARTDAAQFTASDADKAGSLLARAARFIERLLDELVEVSVSSALHADDELDVAHKARLLVGQVLGLHASSVRETSYMPPLDAVTVSRLHDRLVELKNERDPDAREIQVEALRVILQVEICSRNITTPQMTTPGKSLP
jgi:hypothetical protein